MVQKPLSAMKKRKELPPAYRPENRVRAGVGTMSDNELLAVILGSGVAGHNVKSIATKLLTKLGEKLLDASVDDLASVPGMGHIKASKLVAAFELYRRLSSGLPGQIVASPAEVATICADLGSRRQEVVGFLALDSRHALVKRVDLYAGSESASLVDPKHVFRAALEEKAQYIVVYHNHPGGNADPSEADRQLAERLTRCGADLNLPLLDFVILSKRGFVSLLLAGAGEASPPLAFQGYSQLSLASILVENPRNWPPRINRTTPSGKKILWAVDLFAGCGGLSLGLEQAGFKSLLVSELNKDAMDTYMVNRSQQENSITSINDVYSLTNEMLDDIVKGWRELGIDGVDIVAGGPPCQGYSGIGHRRSYKVDKDEIPSNHLFKEMARVIGKLRPRMFLFENVRGLLSSRWTPGGRKGEIWEAVQAAFRAINGGEYFVDFKLVQAKDYGIPQNRPRILMVGIRKDLKYIPKSVACASGLLPEPCGAPPPSVEDLLSDLVDPAYLEKKRTDRYLHEPLNDVQQMLRTLRDGTTVAHKNDPLMEQDYSNHAPNIREKFQYMLDHDGVIPKHMRTKKFAQRVLPRIWDDRGPTITVTSLPEDYVHYCQPRSLTVREWARLQMFPDWYEFKGSRTTGGIRRAGNPHKGIWDREVPKYTQIGNAVPVELARKVGIHLAQILKGL